MCRACLAEGRLVAAECVDHIVPHKGNSLLFWDKRNWQPLCNACHSHKTASSDGGFGNITPPPHTEVTHVQGQPGNRDRSE